MFTCSRLNQRTATQDARKRSHCPKDNGSIQCIRADDTVADYSYCCDDKDVNGNIEDKDSDDYKNADSKHFDDKDDKDDGKEHDKDHNKYNEKDDNKDGD